MVRFYDGENLNWVKIIDLSGGDVYNPQLIIRSDLWRYGDIGVSVTGMVDTMELDSRRSIHPMHMIKRIL